MDTMDTNSDLKKETFEFIHKHILKPKFNSNSSKLIWWENLNSIHIKNYLSQFSSSRDLKQQVYNFINNTRDKKCNCGNPSIFKSFGAGYSKHCSIRCVNLDPQIQDKIKKTNIERYGKESFLSGSKEELFLKTIGVSNPSKSKEVLHKTKSTKLTKYGNKNYNNQSRMKCTTLERHGNENFKNTDKIKKTNIERYGKESFLSGSKEELFLKTIGVSNPSKSKEVQRKKKQNSMTKYGRLFQQRHLVEGAQDKISKEYLSENSVFEIQRETGYSQTQINKFMREYGVSSGFRSNGEQDVYNEIRKFYDGEILINKRKIINGLELDLYIPEFNIAIEFNGDWWHSDNFKQSHKEKFKLCEERGIFLLQIFEFQWKGNLKNIFISMLRSRMKMNRRVYARKCNLKEVCISEAREFLDSNHIQGYTNSSTRMGLYDKGNLVSIMTFGKSRFKKGEMELLRFCNLKGVSVIGGASKIMKNFLKMYEVNEIMSFSDNLYSDGGLYRTLGFKKLYETQGFFFTDGKIKISRFKLQKAKIKGLVANSEKMSGKEIAKGLGFLLIYDACQTKWKYEV